MKVVVLAATPLEAAQLTETLGAAVVIGGIGAVNTAHALTAFLATQSRPQLVIQTGIAGAYAPGGLEPGSVALASEEMYGDVGVLTPEGWQPADLIGIPLVAARATRPARYNRFPLDSRLVGRAAALAGALVARTGRFLTLSQVTGLRELGDALHRRFDAICESMEGAAAAQICELYDVPFLEVRGVSNLVDDRARHTWLVREAAAAAQSVVRRLVEQADALLEDSRS